MIPVFLVFLFLIQLLGFYALALLYTKVSKFDDLEKKQQKIMSEMDDSIGLYLAELKDENDRLITKLAEMEMKVADSKIVKKSFEESPTPEIMQSSPKIHVNPPIRPVNLALKSYSQASAFQEKKDVEEIDDRTKVLQLHDLGRSVEEIAKEIGKGRTEVELMLKFIRS